MKHILTIATCCILFSCSNSFINHTLTMEKLGDCRPDATPIKMISNINGERYEFNACADADFDGKSYSVERRGDSLVLVLPKTASKKQALFKMVLDIDAKPPYQHMVIDGKTIKIVQTER